MKKYFLFLILLLTSLTSYTNPPPADAVFQLTTRATDPNSFMLEWTIEKGFFLYKKRIKLTKPSDSNFNLGTLIYPESLEKTDAQGHSFPIYRNQMALRVPVLGKTPGESSITVHFQGCADDGFCYPPQQIKIRLAFDTKLALSQVSLEENPIPSPVEQIHPNELEQLFSSNNWIFIICSFFGFGLLLAFTPCVLPMVPVLSGIIVGHGHQLSTRKAFLLSLSYVLSMSVTYSLIGAVIAFMGNNLQVIMQSPWAITLFSLMFVGLALSMFNVYELKLPVSLQSKMANITRSQHGGHYLSAAVMGCLSILILSPCVTAPLIGVLGYIAHEGNIGLGILSLFFLGLGMGTPLLLIGTSAGKLLPRAGLWMNKVKSLFGILMLGVAIYLLARILPAVAIMVLWACLLIFSGIYSGALSKTTSTSEKFSQGFGLILLCYGLLILIGASQGHENPLLPLKGTEKTVNLVQKNTATTVKEAQSVLREAVIAGKPVVVDFYADWCTSCKIISATTLRDPQVQAALEKIIFLTIDLSENNAESQQLLRYFNVIAPPTFLFFNAQGEELDNLRVTGELSAGVLLEKLKDAF